MTTSPTEVEVEEEKEREKERLRASRACSLDSAAEDDRNDTTQGPSSCAYGAGQEEAAGLVFEAGNRPEVLQAAPQQQAVRTTPATTHPAAQATQADTSDLSAADVVLADKDTTQPGGEDVNSAESLFDVGAEMVHAPVPPTTAAAEADGWTQPRQQQATEVLNAWWATQGAGWSQSYTVVYRCVMHALIQGLAPSTIVRKLAEHAESGEKITNASLGRKKPARPAYATDERRALATDILNPWWSVYAAGWPQTYAVVHRVLVSLLSQGISEDDIKQALRVLGPERKPISGGTVGFALSKSTQQVAEERKYEALAASRTADKYHQRTM